MAVSDKGTVSPERTLSGRDLNGEGSSHVNSVGQREMHVQRKSLRWNRMVLGLKCGIHCVESRVKFLPKCREINNEKNVFSRELPSSPKAASQGKAHCEGTDWGIRDQASSLRQLVTCLRV